MKRMPFIDPFDIRYRRFETVPKPVAQAVMFCLMDVSGSMAEHMKDLAKRFYMLLYLFLKRRYKHVDIVFIRHTHEAKEVDEETFFHSPQTGGTVVSTRAGGDARRSSATLSAERVEHLRRAGLRRRQRRCDDPKHRRSLLTDLILPLMPVLRLSRSRPTRPACSSRCRIRRCGAV